MNRDYARDIVPFNYNGEEIHGNLTTYYNGVTEKYRTFMFNYKNTNVNIFLKEEQNYYFVAPLHCKIIDKLGIEVYKKYDKLLEDTHSIERDYIIVNEKVYNFYCQLINQSPKYYLLGLIMEDGTHYDGTYVFTNIKEKGNKRKLFNNLQFQALNYFKQNNIEPSKDQLNIEKTKEYQEVKNSIKEILEPL